MKFLIGSTEKSSYNFSDGSFSRVNETKESESKLLHGFTGACKGDSGGPGWVKVKTKVSKIESVQNGGHLISYESIEDFSQL